MAQQVDGVEFSVIVDSSSAVTATNRVVEANEDVERSFSRVDSASRKTGSTVVKQSRASAAGMGNFSRQAGQAGIQVQQLVGQIQGGQSVFGALSAQAADLGIVLGAPLAGAIAGLAAAFGGALLPSLFNSKTAMQKLDEVAEKLSETFKKTDNGTIQLGEGIAELARKSKSLAKIKIASSIKDAEEQIKSSVGGIGSAIQDMAKISAKDFNQAIFDAGISMEQLASDTFDTSNAVDNLGAGGVGRLNKMRDVVSELSRRFDISKEQAVSLGSAISDFQNNPGPIGVKRLQTALENLNDETGNSNDKLTNFASTLIPFFQKTMEGVDVTNLFRQALADLNGTLNKTKPPTSEMQEYAGNIQSLAQAIALTEAELAGNTEEAMRLQAAFQFGVSTFEQLPKDAQALVMRLQAVRGQQQQNAEAEVAAEQAKRKEQLETIRQKQELESQFKSISGTNLESGQTELESIQAKYQAERDIIKQHLQMKMQDQQMSDAELQALAQQHANQIIGINERQKDAQEKLAQREKDAKISALSSTFSNLSSLMNTESKKLFAIGKASAVAGAIVDGYAAVAKTMASVPYPFNIPLAAAQAAASAVQIQNIMKTKMGDSGSGQSFNGGQVVNNTATQQGQQQPEQRNVSIALTGSSFTGGDIRTLIGQINEELGDGVTLNTTGG